MSKKFRMFLVLIVFDLFFACMYYLWQIEGVVQAGNVFMFMIWFVGVCGVLMVFAPHSPRGHVEVYVIHKPVSRAFSAAFLVGTIWSGHLVAALFYLLAWFVLYCRQERSKELWMEQQRVAQHETEVIA